MPKIETHSGARKRFRISKNGKAIRGYAFKSHILNKKSTKRERVLHQAIVTGVTNMAKVKKMLPYK